MDIKNFINEATKDIDHTVTTGGGDFEYTPPPAGPTVGVFIEYIELGMQKQPDYQGKPKPPVESVRLTFALTHPTKNTKEIDVEGGKKKIQDRISFDISIKLNEKAKFKKIFEKMRYGRDGITHMAQMLGDKFRLDVTHNEVGEKEKKRVYANLWNEQGEIGISAPFVDDPIAGSRTDIRSKIPEALDPLKVFLWGRPTKETWDTLFVDGTRTVKDEKGQEKEVSKNWLQERIINATDYKGSALENLLSGLDNLHTEATKHQEQAGDNIDIDLEGGALEDKKQSAESKVTTSSDADDALAALGLT